MLYFILGWYRSNPIKRCHVLYPLTLATDSKTSPILGKLNEWNESVNLFRKTAVNHIRKKSKNCQSKTGKDKRTSHDWLIRFIRLICTAGAMFPKDSLFQSSMSSSSGEGGAMKLGLGRRLSNTCWKIVCASWVASGVAFT